jgi:SAM-dependent methyltransferase
MHIESKAFTIYVRSLLLEYFVFKKILDVGAGDINGNNRHLFDKCEYHANDVYEAPNITIISRTKDLKYEDETFDTIISTECFEHDPDYKDSLKNIYRMLKPGGLFLFTCASTNRPEHGTLRTSPQDSYGTIGKIEDMQDYYKNLTEKDLDEIFNLKQMFCIYDTYYNMISRDLCFIGIKQGLKNKNINYLNKIRLPGLLYTTNDHIKKISYSHYYYGHQLILTDNGKVYGIGRNIEQQIIDNDVKFIQQPLLLDLDDVKDIECKENKSIITFKNDTIQVMGK